VGGALSSEVQAGGAQDKRIAKKPFHTRRYDEDKIVTDSLGAVAQEKKIKREKVGICKIP
jgi:hypothetical protein